MTTAIVELAHAQALSLADKSSYSEERPIKPTMTPAVIAFEQEPFLLHDKAE